MKLKTDKPFGLSSGFVCMGIVSDSGKDYACILQISNGQEYIEELHWGTGKNIENATLHQVDDNKEWAHLVKSVQSLTTIFSPAKINAIRKKPELYFYSDRYKKTDDYLKRKERGTV